MTPRRAPLVHVVGRARPADRVTATARGLHRRLEGAGRPGRLVAAHPQPGFDVLGAGEDLSGGTVLVHSVDGAEALAELLPTLTAQPITLVHHGSARGSDRRVLRVLRGHTVRAVAADPAAREELRGLGFGSVEQLEADVVDEALDDVAPDADAVEHLARHPGAMLLSIGPLAPGRSVELLIDAFAALLTGPRPAATLSLCGPSSPWYLATLRRRIASRGLRACELLSPASDGEAMARLHRADALVALHPVGLDPFLRRAARHGVPVVSPRGAGSAWLGDQLVPVAPRVRIDALVAAMATATASPRRPARPRPAGGGTTTPELLRVLGLG